MKKRKEGYKIVFGKCPKCLKAIERIGCFKGRWLVGYIGANCSHCDYFDKPDLNNIEKAPKQPTPTRKKTRSKGVKRRNSYIVSQMV